MIQSLVVASIVAVSIAWVTWRVILPARARGWALRRLGIAVKPAEGCGGCCGCSSGSGNEKGAVH